MTIHTHLLNGFTAVAELDSQIESSTVHLLNLQDLLFTAEDACTLVRMHAQWWARDAQVHYVAHRPVTRGTCVVAAHSAGDGHCQVATNVAGAKMAIEHGMGRLEPGLQHFVGDAISASFGPPRFGHRVIATPMDWIGRLQNGYSVPFIANVLSTFGFSGLTSLFPVLAEAERQAHELYGPIYGRLVTAMSTLGNGCTACLYGHLYAANLLYFEKSGGIGPIAELETDALLQLPDDQLGAFLQGRLSDTEWAEALPPLMRIQALRSGREPQDEEDVALQHGLLAWSLINECSLQAPMDVAPPFDPRLARNRRLQRAYRQAREGKVR